MIKRRIVLGSVLALPLLNVSANYDVNPANVGSYCPNAHEWALLREINEWRAQNGVHPLRMSRSLSAAAHHHTHYMSITDDVDHSLGNISWSQNILNYGYPSGYAMGEIVAAGRKSAAGTVQQWKNSPTHNSVMLDTSYIRMGGGRTYRSSGDYKYYWCVTFGSKSHRTISTC